MPRPRSQVTQEAKNRLIERLEAGGLRPGSRFYSNRAVARIFGISYQTAHRLLDELVAEGRLRRDPSSGTFVAGQVEVIDGVELWFHPRAKRAGSFGHRLLESLQAGLKQEGIAMVVKFGERARPALNRYPIVWECSGALDAMSGRYGLLLNQEAPPGMRASFVDSISIDDYSGGVAAAEWLALQGEHRSVSVLAGPRDDPRSRRRVEGFSSIYPKAQVVWADGWYLEDGLQLAGQVATAAAVFCGNDRLAEAVVQHCRGHGKALPWLIGFDDAPVAAELGISTVAIPWEEMARAAVQIAVRRLAGEPRQASRRARLPGCRGAQTVNEVRHLG